MGSSPRTHRARGQRRPAPVPAADYRGRVVVLDVRGSSCPPCRKEAPVLGDAAGEPAGQDVAILGIDTRDSSQDQGSADLRPYDVPHLSILDPAGTLDPSAIPSTVVLDEQGRVAASILGEIPSRRTLVDLVEDVRG